MSSNENGNGEGRDAAGRFTPGNRAALGHTNPLAAQAALLRRALLEALTPEDIRAIADVLKRRSKDGDVRSAALVLAYAVGKPVEHDLLERLEALEQEADS